MSQSEDESWLPKPSSRTAPFFEAASEGKLRLQCCDDCATWTFPYRERCQHCGSRSIVWRDASGRGTLYSHGLLQRAYHPRHEDRLPIVLAQVDVAEGGAPFNQSRGRGAGRSQGWDGGRSGVRELTRRRHHPGV